MEEHQVKLDITRQKAEIDMQIKQAKAAQDRALKDMDRVMKQQN
jgi:hypothetical protein